MKITICKSWTFEAAHRLPRLPPTHKCHHMHGHTYRVDIELARFLGNEDVNDHLCMVVDYDVLDGVVRPVLDLVDHKVLNEVSGIGDFATTERLAAWFFDEVYSTLSDARHHKALRLAESDAIYLAAVRVYESASTWAERRPDEHRYPIR